MRLIDFRIQKERNKNKKRNTNEAKRPSRCSYHVKIRIYLESHQETIKLIKIIEIQIYSNRYAFCSFDFSFYLNKYFPLSSFWFASDSNALTSKPCQVCVSWCKCFACAIYFTLETIRLLLTFWLMKLVGCQLCVCVCVRSGKFIRNT